MSRRLCYIVSISLLAKNDIVLIHHRKVFISGDAGRIFTRGAQVGNPYAKVGRCKKSSLWADPLSVKVSFDVCMWVLTGGSGVRLCKQLVPIVILEPYLEESW